MTKPAEQDTHCGTSPWRIISAQFPALPSRALSPSVQEVAVLSISILAQLQLHWVSPWSRRLFITRGGSNFETLLLNVVRPGEWLYSSQDKMWPSSTPKQGSVTKPGPISIRTVWLPTYGSAQDHKHSDNPINDCVTVPNATGREWVLPSSPYEACVSQKNIASEGCILPERREAPLTAIYMCPAPAPIGDRPSYDIS